MPVTSVGSLEVLFHPAASLGGPSTAPVDRPAKFLIPSALHGTTCIMVRRGRGQIGKAGITNTFPTTSTTASPVTSAPPAAAASTSSPSSAVSPIAQKQQRSLNPREVLSRKDSHAANKASGNIMMSSSAGGAAAKAGFVAEEEGSAGCRMVDTRGREERSSEDSRMAGADDEGAAIAEFEAALVRTAPRTVRCCLYRAILYRMSRDFRRRMSCCAASD